MKRRRFLGALLLAACNHPSSPLAPRRHGIRRPPNEPIVDDFAAARTNMEPSPFATQGERLVDRRERELWFWDARTLRDENVLSYGYQASCILQDGSVVALRRTESDDYEVHRISPVFAVEVSRIDGAGRSSRVLAAGVAGECLLTTAASEVARYRFDDRVMNLVGHVGTSFSAPSLRQLTSLLDGRVMAADGEGVVIAGPGPVTKRLRLDGRTPSHLARAAADRVWISHGAPTARPRAISLCRLGDPLVIEAHLDFAPARVVHMAAAEQGSLAVLLDATTAAGGQWFVVLVDARGAELWRVDLAATGTAGLYDRAFVALTTTRLVLARDADPLRAWDVARGTELVLTAGSTNAPG